MENLFGAWREFVRGRKNKNDVAEFSLNLSKNIFCLHEDLRTKTYRHGPYKHFKIADPKPRNIHKATVRDRLLHHAIYRILYPYFDKKFIHDSYSCRNFKGTHRAINRFRDFGRKVSRNNSRTCWVLKCDVRKFFASIDHEVLLRILAKQICDRDTLGLLERVIESFQTESPIYAMAEIKKGLPLGNLTSQLWVNIYMNEFDQFVKHKLKVKYYIRYADDFVVLDSDKGKLETMLRYIVLFLRERLKLELHPDKVSIKTLVSGVDFLGWVNFPDHRVLRTATKRRMFKKSVLSDKPETRQSYLGLLGHGNTWKLRKFLAGIAT
ncbi:MAG: reverse transcriptase/maturase family protein [Candidatus Paceibacterota bacterium]